MELFTREGYIFPYSWNVYLCLLILLLVWISFIIKDLEIRTNTEVKIDRCQVSCVFRMASSVMVNEVGSL